MQRGVVCALDVQSRRTAVSLSTLLLLSRSLSRSLSYKRLHDPPRVAPRDREREMQCRACPVVNDPARLQRRAGERPTERLAECE